MFHVNWIDLFIIILASFRLTHLIVFDEIAAFIRKPFISVTIIENSSGELEQNIEIKGTGIRHFIGSLLSCYWCSGLWCSLFVVLLYCFFPITFPIFLVLAVAGAAAIIESKI
jgi:hypothetical protein